MLAINFKFGVRFRVYLLGKPHSTSLITQLKFVSEIVFYLETKGDGDPCLKVSVTEKRII